MEIISLKISDLKTDPNNARKHDEKNIKSIMGSLEKFGQQKPIVIRKKENIVAAGSGTLEAAKRLGWQNIDCVRSDLNQKNLKAYALADNRTAELAVWDDDILDQQLKDLQINGFDLEKIGFDPLNLSDGESNNSENDDHVPETNENEFGVKRGDIWQLGNHRLMCGDATNRTDVDRLMAGEKADMVFTDPPYGIGFVENRNFDKGFKSSPPPEKGGNPKLGNYNPMIGDQQQNFDPNICINLAREVFLFGGDYYADKLPVNGSWIVWDKHRSESDTKIPFGNEFELCWSKVRHRKEIAKIQWIGIGGVKDDTNAKKRLHPTQKPVQLPEWFIEKWGKDKNLVVDLFLGSGSTLIACEKTNRRCFGMEISEHYVSVVIERWERYTGKKAVKL